MKSALLRNSLLARISVIALPASACGQDTAKDKDQAAIIVTGSRTIKNGNNSPSPLTVVSVEQLQASAPSNIPDALNRLPVFSG